MFTRRPLLIVVLSLLWLALGASTSWANAPVLFSGERGEWFVNDAFTTDNGQPQGGTCNFGSGPAGSGGAIEDAVIGGDTPEEVAADAFDGAAMVWVDGTQVGGNAAAFTSDEATFTPVTISGLTVQLNYRTLSTQSTLRVLVRLTNPTASQVAVPVEYVNNFGSGGGFTITAVATSSGDTLYGPEDRWLINDDGTDLGGTPAITSVFYGPDSPREMPLSTSATVFDCAGTVGSFDSFHLEVAPGATETLMFFEQIKRDSFDAQNAASQFDVTPAFGDSLTEGMSEEDYQTLVNWRTGGEPECSDGIDNDGDGKVDYPADRQCDSAADESELPQCSDTIDNDGDGKVDYPADTGCSSLRDNTEAPNPQCSDQADNDGDGSVDYPADTGCSSLRDNTEAPNPQCSDGIDNDADGNTDYPADTGCSSTRDNTEAPNPQCSDGIDNDADGKVDYPADTACSSLRDNTET